MLELRFPLVDTEELLLRVSPRSLGKAWKRTASFDLSISWKLAQRTARKWSALLSHFAELLDRSDNGTFSLPSPPQAKTALHHSLLLGVSHRSSRSLQSEAYAAELHWASFVGYKSLMTEDLYPHTTPLGDVVSTEIILEDWKHSLPSITNGAAPIVSVSTSTSPFAQWPAASAHAPKPTISSAGNLTVIWRICVKNRPLQALVQGAEVHLGVFWWWHPELASSTVHAHFVFELYEAFEVPPGTQVIFEGNPDSLNDRKIEVLATVGRVTRLTIGSDPGRCCAKAHQAPQQTALCQ